MTKLNKLHEKLESDPRFNPIFGENELIFTRYGTNGAGSKSEYFFKEKNGELYVYKRLTVYNPVTSTYQMIDETSWLKMCTVEEAVHFVKYG